ncbi:Ca(2+)-dependent cysteine protease, partial [Tulasnella sp. 408]
HGGQLPSTSDHSELDGKDEIVYTLENDKKTCGIIKDNDLRRILADGLPVGANLTASAVLELCSSGTMMDLPFRLVTSKSGPPTLADAKFNPRELKGNILCLSACEDAQKAHHFKHSLGEQGILTTVIAPTLSKFGIQARKAREVNDIPEASAAQAQAPRIRVLDLLDGLVATVNQLRGKRPQQTPMVTIGRSLSSSELGNLIFEP